MEPADDADAPLAEPRWPMPTRRCPAADAPLADPAEIRRAMEYYADRDWTDGLPVVPVTESYLAGFLAQTSRGPDEVVLAMPHLNRRCTVRLAAINAAHGGLPAGVLPGGAGRLGVPGRRGVRRPAGSGRAPPGRRRS